jgi:hypothetical protein
MNNCVRWVLPPAVLGQHSDVSPRTTREARLGYRLTGIRATITHQKHEAPAFLASSLIMPLQPAKLLTIQVFDTF